MKMTGLIPAQSGTAFRLLRGETLTIIDVEGEQVCDLFCVAVDRIDDTLSSGRSIDYNETVYLTTKHKLYSNSSREMLTIMGDTCGRHDFLLTPCSLQMFRLVTGKNCDHPSCLSNLSSSLQPYSIPETAITTTFNIFMNVEVGSDGGIKILPPRSRPGDHIQLRAEMDLIVGLTACSDEGTNNGRCKPIRFEIDRLG